MDFDVNSLNTGEVLSIKELIDTLQCKHPVVACPFCSCCAFCKHLQHISDKCQEVLEERGVYDND